MSERSVDARGLACPQPVILARRAMMEPDTTLVRVMVDSEISVENLRRLAQSLGWEATVWPHGSEYHIDIAPGDAASSPGESAELAGEAAPAAEAAPAEDLAPSGSAPPAGTGTVIFISSDRFGRGEEELGRILMRSFVKTLGALDHPPAKILLANTGVRLSTRGSELIDDLRDLEARGVTILSCGTCLDYLGSIDSLEVGRQCDMLEIASSLFDADRVVQP